MNETNCLKIPSPASYHPNCKVLVVAYSTLNGVVYLFLKNDESLLSHANYWLFYWQDHLGLANLCDSSFTEVRYKFVVKKFYLFP